MKPLVGLVCLAIVLAGCQQPQPAANPFMRTAVPPPGTGQAAAPVIVDPYYPPSVPGPTPTAPTAPAAPVVVQPAAPVAAPPPAAGPPDQYKPTPGMVDFFYHQSSTQREKAVDPHAPGYREGSTAQMRRSRAAGSSEPAATAAAASAIAANVAPSQSRGAAVTADSVAKFTTEPSGPAAARLEAMAQDDKPQVTQASFREAGESDSASDESGSAEVAARIPITATGPLHVTSHATRDARTGSDNTLRIVGQNESSSSTAEVAAADHEQASAGTPRIKLTVDGPGESTNAVPQPGWLASAPEVDRGANEDRARSDEGVTLAGGVDPFADPTESTAARLAAGTTEVHSREPAVKQAVATVAARQPARTARQAVPTSIEKEMAPANGPGYSYATNYEWLRGRLEYSQSAKQWKLRYIPIDGQTDRYGGSVVLPSSPLLEGRTPGEFVSIQGVVGQAPGTSGSFSPLYELRQLEPLSR